MGVASNWKMAAVSTYETGGGNAAIAALIAMADYCLTQKPQQIKEAVQCYIGVLSLSPPLRVEARIRLQLGLTLYHHTNNLLEARQTLEQAMLLAKSTAGLEQIRYEAVSLLSRIHMEQGYAHNAKVVLKSALEISHRSPYWHCRLLLQKADIHVYEKDIDNLMSTLTQVADYAHHVNAPCTRILCLLSKGALKMAKSHMKQLQQCIKLLNSEESVTETELSAESFDWFNKEQTYVLVYLVCVMHFLLVGHSERALSFIIKAMNVVQNRKDINNSVMTVFEAHLLELIITIALIQGDCTKAGQKLQEMINVCHSHPQMMYSHRAVLHTLLGLYAFATDNNDKSIAQFQTALQHTNSLELKVFININLAISYMRIGESRHEELAALLESLQSEDVESLSSKNLQAALTFLKGLHAFHELKFHESKRFLRETISISNGNDLNKLSACSLILLGQIFLSLGNTKESKETIDPAFQLAMKLSDKKLQAWTASLLVDLHHAFGNIESKHQSQFTLNAVQGDLAADCQKAKHSPHHSLIQWTIGNWPVKQDLKEQDLKCHKEESNRKLTSNVHRTKHKSTQDEASSNLDLHAHVHHQLKHPEDHLISQADTIATLLDYGNSQNNDINFQSGHITSKAHHMTPQSDRITSKAHHMTPQSDHMTSKAHHMTPQSDRITSKAHHMTPQSDHMTSKAHHITPQSGHMTSKAPHIPHAKHILPQTDPLIINSQRTPQTETPPIDYLHLAQQLPQRHHSTYQRHQIIPEQSKESHIDSLYYSDKKRPKLHDEDSTVPYDPIVIRVDEPNVKHPLQTPPPKPSSSNTSSYSSSSSCQSAFISPSSHLTPPPSLSHHEQSSSKQQIHFNSLSSSSFPSSHTVPNILPSIDLVTTQHYSPVVRHKESPLTRSDTISYNEQPHQFLHQRPLPLHQNPSPLNMKPSPLHQTPYQRLIPKGSPLMLHQSLPVHHSPHHGSYYNHVTSFTDPFHQYGYSALSPEAILRQRQQFQQPQTFGNASPHPMMASNHALMSGTQLPPVGHMYQQQYYHGHLPSSEHPEMSRLPHSRH